MAQLGARLAGSEKVRGSNPLFSTNYRMARKRPMFAGHSLFTKAECCLAKKQMDSTGQAEIPLGLLLPSVQHVFGYDSSIYDAAGYLPFH